jgi:type IV secretory pathway TrbF-like protein
MSSSQAADAQSGRFVQGVQKYQEQRAKDRKERDDARTFASRLYVVTVLALIGLTIFGAAGMISIAMLRTGAKDRFWGVPENSAGVQQGAAFVLSSLPPGTNADLAARLADWPGNAFSVSTDRTTETTTLGRTYAYLDGTALKQYNNYLDQDNGAFSPFTIGATHSVSVKMLKYPALLPRSNNTWDVEWQESIYQQPGAHLLQQQNCELYLSVGTFASVPTSQYDPDGALFRQFNPHAYAIESFTPVHTVGVDPNDCGLGGI